ncbi:MAG: sugar ABC transporter ATP-binding protein [Planctomycetota bacterium]
MTDDRLSVSNLNKSYGHVDVLQDVSLSLRAGEILGLLGANGAGKSTFCRIISGLELDFGGSVSLDGHSYRPKNKQQAESCGVEIVQQELNLIPTLSVAENLFLSRLPSRAGWIRRSHLRREARQVLDRHGLQDVSVDTLVNDLGVGRRQMVEIAAALARQCKVLILDEPTAALSATESERLFQHLDGLRRDGVGIIYVSHRLDEVAAWCDRAAILRDGQCVAIRQCDSLSTEDMVALMTGQSSRATARAHVTHRSSEVTMSLESLSTDKVHDVSFSLRRGERMGVAGLVGSGRTELFRAVFGADPIQSGGIRLAERPGLERFGHPREAVAAGLAMLTEDRKSSGLLLRHSIVFNTSLAELRNGLSTCGWVRTRDEREKANRLCERLQTHCDSIDQSVGTLSGGNQQKVAVSKWLLGEADVFLFDEPTRGIDVAARRKLYDLFDDLAEQGKSMLIASGDLDELLEICDSILVMSAGKMAGLFERSNWNKDMIMKASFAGYTT